MVVQTHEHLHLELMEVPHLGSISVWFLVGNGGMDPYSSFYIIPNKSPHNPFHTKNQTDMRLVNSPCARIDHILTCECPLSRKPEIPKTDVEKSTHILSCELPHSRLEQFQNITRIVPDLQCFRMRWYSRKHEATAQRIKPCQDRHWIAQACPAVCHVRCHSVLNIRMVSRSCHP